MLGTMSHWGLKLTLDYYAPKPPLPAWVERAKKAHGNAIENLVILAPAILVFLHATADAGGDAIILSLQVYFIARLVHYIVYATGTPYLRAIVFFVGWIATLCIIRKTIAITV